MIIKIPNGGIIIELGSPDPNNPNRSLPGVIIKGNLKDDFKLDNTAMGVSNLSLPNDIFNSMMAALESILLAHACAGIDITSPAYIEGLNTAIDACSNII